MGTMSPQAIKWNATTQFEPVGSGEKSEKLYHMKSVKVFALTALLSLGAVTAARPGVVSTTLHGPGAHDFDGMIGVGDVIAGQLGTELPPLLGWHPANGNPADHLPAFTDGAGLLGSGLTGLLNDFPAPGIPAKTVQYSFPATDIARLQVLTGNAGADGRIFSTTVVEYSVNGGGAFNTLGYFQSDPSGTINQGVNKSTLVSIFDDSSPVLMAGVTDIIFKL